MKMSLLKMELVLISVFYLFNIIVAQSDNPCPNIFNYRTQGASTANYPALYGIINAAAPENFQGLMKLEIQLSIGNLLENTQGSIELMTPSSQVEQTIQQNRPLLFKVNFPYWINIKPKVTKISVNDRLICQGEPIREELIRETTGKLTTLTLTFRLQVSNAPSYSPPGNQPTFSKPTYIQPIYPPITQPPVVTQAPQNYIPSTFNDIDKYFPQQQPSVAQPAAQPPTSAIATSNFNFGSSNCGKLVQAVSLIVGGEEFPEGANPWLAALFKKKDGRHQFICGSNIISKKHVITAAHCVSGVKDISRFSLALGRNDIYDWTTGASRKLSTIHIHYDYKVNQPDADLAVLLMSQEVQFSSTISSICIWNNNFNLQQTIGSTGIVAGWGIDESGNVSSTPKQITMPIVSEENCLRSADDFYYVTSNRTFCAGFRNNTGPCNGDSGGGFYVEKDDRWYIRGIVSHSLSTKNRTCDLNNYIVFADIAQHTEWIMSHLT